MTNISGSTIYSIVSTISLVGGAILVLKSRIPKITIDNLVQLNDTYEKRIKALEEEIGTFNSQHLENVKAIADLQGQVKVYKDLPLQELAIGIQKVGQTNKEILDTLKASALVLVKDTEKAAEAVSGVKKSLKDKEAGRVS